MKKLLFALGLFAVGAVRAQAPAQAAYWQQHICYSIDVALNDQQHSLSGTADMTYINRSPDGLDFIWIHLWPNAYKDNKTAFAKQLLREKEGKSQLKAMKDNGYIDSLRFTVDGAEARTEAHPEHTDIVKLLLPKPLRPGDSVRIRTPFYVKLPTYISRSGHNGQSYMIAQWYPKPAVYDRKGWHPIPYLDQGEFYNEYGDYTVNITLPGAYIVGATGELQDAEELARYKQLGTANRGTDNDAPYTNNSASKTLRYSARNVPDFAWFADKGFVIEYDTLQLQPTARPIDVFAYHHPAGNPAWQRSTNFIKDAVRSYSRWIGPYAFPTVQAVEGPKNDNSGGMEYPMITLITMPDATDTTLDAVITHEVGHNWFPMMVATDERTYGFMDEGFNTYYEFLYEAEKYKTNLVLGSVLPAEVRKLPTDQFLGMIYNALNGIPMNAAINTPATGFRNKEEYGMVTYMKTATWMYILELSIGKEALHNAMRQYFSDWQFRHPYPEDFKASLEKATGKDLSDLFKGLEEKGAFK
ncbi:M1 family metallopeptidase [Flaviaesturariibacter amylovorans]|uniref:Peptidase M1 membrane alanine aminopeptidase domain-containing protein n=1 Tax=Flaviaesturariibacter amylovorans TaxID=1084520 RepID=A0ABP8H2E9_9BACT